MFPSVAAEFAFENIVYIGRGVPQYDRVGSLSDEMAEGRVTPA